jgi:DNA-binding NarL/FixJ family response regulator
MGFRVVLAYVQPLLTDIIRDSAMGEPDLELVAAVEHPDALLPVLQRVQPDVLILETAPREGLALARQLWARWPRLRMLTIARGGRSAVLHLLRPDETVLGDVSPQELVSAIRGGPAW